MLALRPLIAILAVVIVPLVTILVWLQPDLDPNLRLAVLAAGVFASLALLRRSVFQPLRALRLWRNYARGNKYEFHGSLSHEPFVRGTHLGRRFVAGVSAHRVNTGRGRYRTLVSATIDSNLPAGLRVYSTALDIWLNDYSERDTIHTGNEEVEGNLRCEGRVAEDVRSYLAHTRHLLLAFANKHPTMLLHGAFSQEMPAEPGGAAGVITVSIPGRVEDIGQLESLVSDVCEFAVSLDGVRPAYTVAS